MSTNISKEDYLKMLEELYEESYGSEEDVSIESWMPSEPFAKERMKKAEQNKVLDILKYKKNKIQESLYSHTNIKIGPYLIRIHEYHGLPDRVNKQANLSMDISVWETKYRTPSGAPCRMEYRKNFHTDDRFQNKPWLNYFNNSGDAHNIPVETVVDVIRWLQAIQRMTVFL